MVTQLTINNFEQEVLQSDKPVMVDFYADWCGPCKMIAPVVDEIATGMAATLKVCKINIDQAPDIARKYSVMSIPTLVFIKNREYVSKIIGAKPKNEIVAEIMKIL